VAAAPDFDPATGVSDPIEHLAIAASHPPWLIERWINSFGIAEAAGLAHANNQPAPLAFRLTAKAVLHLQDPDRIIEQLKAGGAHLSPSQIAANAWRLTGDRDLIRQLAAENLIYFQDEASQLVAQMVQLQPGDKVLDVCAAPGGKTTLMAALAPRSMILAGDLHLHRLRTLMDLANLQEATAIHSVAYDASKPLPFPRRVFDRVLVDAPCSGTGTLRRNPEIRWRLRPSDISDLAAKQAQILANAAQMVKPGGLLIYSTCAIDREENEAIVESFLIKHPEFQPASLFTPSRQISSGVYRTWPHRDDVDGFFVAGFSHIDAGL
jgi:16S rRNA (cytosine967-C5)-methyltransferase